jgi:hypothetical protein
MDTIVSDRMSLDEYQIYHGAVHAMTILQARETFSLHRHTQRAPLHHHYVAQRASLSFESRCA